MTTPKQFLPRVILARTMSGYRVLEPCEHEKLGPGEVLYVQESLLAEERAKVWKEAAARLSYSFLNPGQGFQPTYGQIENFCNEFRSKAAREGK